jgi:hypothetical protein
MLVEAAKKIDQFHAMVQPPARNEKWQSTGKAETL